VPGIDTTPSTVERQCRWLRRAALAVRVFVGLVTLACAFAGGVLAARVLGMDSPWAWTTAILAGLGVWAVLMGNPALHRLTDRIERAAKGREAPSRAAVDRQRARYGGSSER
jgi:hypothetical protein